MTLADVSDEQIVAAIQEHGGVQPAATALGVSRSSLRHAIDHRNIAVPASANSQVRRGQFPTITRDSLHAAIQPPNLCRVKTFIDLLDEESREVVEEALAYSTQDLSAGALRRWLVGLGFKEDDVPGQDAITSHRNGRRPCRCRG